MKGLLITVLIALAIVVFLFTSKDSRTKEPYAQRVIKQMNKAEQVSLDAKIKAIREALDLYYADNNQYPDVLDVLVPDYLRITELVMDPWGEPFKLETDEEKALILISSGKDRVFGNNDDIKRRL